MRKLAPCENFPLYSTCGNGYFCGCFIFVVVWETTLAWGHLALFLLAKFTNSIPTHCFRCLCSTRSSPKEGPISGIPGTPSRSTIAFPLMYLYLLLPTPLGLALRYLRACRGGGSRYHGPIAISQRYSKCWGPFQYLMPIHDVSQCSTLQICAD